MEVFALYLTGGERKTSRESWPPTQLASAQPFAEMEEPGEGISCRERVYSIWDRKPLSYQEVKKGSKKSNSFPFIIAQPANTVHADSIPGLGRSLEEGMATHSSILAWRIS